MTMNRNLSFAFAVLLLALFAPLLAGEKEPAAAAKPDPILADLGLSATAEWQCRNGTPHPPDLDINIEVQGKLTKTTSSFGEINIDSAVDDAGRKINSCKGESRMQCRFCNPEEDRFIVPVSMQAPSGIRKIRELRGTMSLQTAGRLDVVVLKDLLKKVKNKDQPIEDATLKALGIVVNVEHQKNISREYGGVESLDIEFRWKHVPVVFCEMWDEDGELLPSDRCSISSAEWDPCWASWRRVFKAPIPPTAQLRFLVHKDSRKIRVPFVLKDIAVPTIDKELDIPACREDKFVEATPVLPNDPILADLQFSASVRRNISAQNRAKPHALVVEVCLKGKPLKQTSAYGEVDIESALDESGNPLVFSIDDQRMHDRLCDSEWLNIQFTMQDPPPLQKIRELRGTMALQTGGQFEIVTIDDILKKAKDKGPIDDETLKKLGVVVKKVFYEQDCNASYGGEVRDAMSIDLFWKSNAVVLCDICDKEGGIPLQNSSPSIGWNRPGPVCLWYAFRRSILHDAQLRLTIQKNSRKIRVPFVLKDIAVPPMPKE